MSTKKTANIDGHNLITSYRNLYTLAGKQLQCIEQEDYTALEEILAQKQLIIDSIAGIQTIFSDNQTGVDHKYLIQMISEIMDLEKRSRELLESKNKETAEKILAVKRSNLISNYFRKTDLTINLLEEKI